MPVVGFAVTEMCFRNMWAQLDEKNEDLKDLYMVVHDKKRLKIHTSWRYSCTCSEQKWLTVGPSVYQPNTEDLHSIQKGVFHIQLSDCHFIAKDSLRNHWLWMTLKDKSTAYKSYGKALKKILRTLRVLIETRVA